jgi:hypothetical protein
MLIMVKIYYKLSNVIYLRQESTLCKGIIKRLLKCGMRILCILLLLDGYCGSAQISPIGNAGQTTTAYASGIDNVPIFVWCDNNLSNNLGSLMVSPPATGGPFLYKWYKFQTAPLSWVPLVAGTNPTISNLASGGYRVEITGIGGTVLVCYHAWVWNLGAKTMFTINATGCSSANLSANITANDTFTYYNPPPSASIVSAGTPISVSFTAQHTYVSDLAFYLVGPNGCGNPVVTLCPQSSAQGGGLTCNHGNDINNLTFTTASTANFNMCLAPTPLTGTYGNYGVNNSTHINWVPLYGCDAAEPGWKVMIYDCVGLDSGALTNVGLSFSGFNASCTSQGTIMYNSGAIFAPIRNITCNPLTASRFIVPPLSVYTTPLQVIANRSFNWSASPAVTITGANSSLHPSASGLPYDTTHIDLSVTLTTGIGYCAFGRCGTLCWRYCITDRKWCFEL